MANEYLRRIPTSTGNRRIFTWSSWVKKEAQSVNATLFEATLSGEYRRNFLTWYQGNLYYGAENSSGSTVILVASSSLFRDNNSWYHIIWYIDTTALQLQDRVRIYVNGVQARLNFTTTTNLSINTLQGINATGEHNIGRIPVASGTEQFSGYLADVFFIDGQALTPDVFGFNKPGKGYVSVGSTQATDFRPGQWVPKKPRIIITEINRRGGFGVNGFYLPMNDSNNFGADFHCTPNSIIKLQENLPQPRCRIDGVGDYTGSLRDDPFKQYLVLALPFVSNGLQSGFGDYSHVVRGTGTPKTITTSNVSIGSTASYYGSASNFTSSSSSYITTPRNVSDYNLGSGDFTVEGWFYFKSINTGQYTRFFSIGNGSAGNEEGIIFELVISTSIITFYARDTTITDNLINGPTIVAGQWYHMALVRKSSNLSAYVNGVCVGTADIASRTVNFTSNTAVVIGAWENTIGNYTRFSDCYMQDLRIYKGIAKYMGGFDVPKPYTPVGIATWRAVPDTVTNNFATLNPLYSFSSSNTYTNGNLKAVGSIDNQVTTGNVGFSTGKWYWETRIYNDEMIGLAIPSQYIIGYPGQNTNGFSYHTSGNVYYNGTFSYGVGWSLATYHIVGMAVDWTNRRAYWHVDGVWANNANPSNGSGFYDIALRAPNVSASTDAIPAWRSKTTNASEQISVNFGQNPTFGGEVTAGTFTDSNGKGLFKYQPPTGFLALCEDNLPTPTISDPGKHFKTVLWTGDDATRSITAVGFKPDLVWIKNRSSVYSNHLYDSVRGVNRVLYSDLTNAEFLDDNAVLSFDDNGFSIGGEQPLNRTGDNIVAWCWKAGAGTTTTNTNGSITSVVSVNQDAGFSIVSYTGAGTNTVGHGLGKVPAFMIIKARNEGTASWVVYHKSFGATQWLQLNSTAVVATSSLVWNNTEPTSSVFTIGSGWPTYNYINYCWAEIEGYSKFGSYLGNGSADGPFVYCGFKPAFVLIKNTALLFNWYIIDNSRSSVNPVSQTLSPNLSTVEDTGWSTNSFCDFTSNGFKIRGSNSSINQSGSTIIFAAFAESPFQTANSK